MIPPFSVPSQSVGCLEERREAIAGDAFGIGAIERRETQAVEPHETIEGRQPEVAVPAHVYGADDVLRKPMFGGPDVHPILPHGRGCVERQDHQRDNRARDTPNRRTPIANGRNHAADNAGGSVIQMAYGILRRRQAR